MVTERSETTAQSRGIDRAVLGAAIPIVGYGVPRSVVVNNLGTWPKFRVECCTMLKMKEGRRISSYEHVDVGRGG